MALRQLAQARAAYLIRQWSRARSVSGAAITGAPARSHALVASVKWVARTAALTWHGAYYARFHALRLKARFGAVVSVAALFAFVALSAAASGALQHILDPYVASSDGIATLRTAIVTLGGALVGATAIAFSIVMLAVQINFARMPHGLFHRLSSDWKLLGSFAGSFFLGVSVIAASTIPNRSWASTSLLAASWATVLVLILRAQRAAPLFKTDRPKISRRFAPLTKCHALFFSEPTRIGRRRPARQSPMRSRSHAAMPSRATTKSPASR